MKEIEGDGYICKRCSEKLKEMSYLKSFENTYYLFYYNDVRKIIYDLKFLNRRDIAFDLKDIIEKSIKEIIEKENIHEIVLIPISKKRFLERGYNQVQELIKYSNFPILKSYRVKDTEHMYKLDDKKAREENVKDIFFIDERVQDKNILIFDDIITTGSTMKEMENYLKRKGAKKVTLFTLAIVKEYLKNRNE